MDPIRKVSFAHIKDRKVIFVRSKKNIDTFYNLGGKYESGETDIDCLLREVKEEVNADIDKKTVVFLHEFENEAHGKEGRRLIVRLYTGNLLSRPVPSAEIAEVKYFDSSAEEKIVSKMGKEILLWLKQNGYID